MEPKLPAGKKNVVGSEAIKISVDFTREQVIGYLRELREKNSTADLAFYAYRDMASCNWEPFIKVAMERNPVSLEMTSSMSIGEVYSWLERMRDVSIYDGCRMAQPDEVANYKSADGVEKAFLPEQKLELIVDSNKVVLKGQKEYSFVSGKGLKKQVSLKD